MGRSDNGVRWRESVGRSDDDFHLEEEGLPTDSTPPTLFVTSTPTDSTPPTFFRQINAH